MQTSVRSMALAAFLAAMLASGCADEPLPLVPEVDTVAADEEARVEEALTEASRLEAFALESDGGVASLVESISSESGRASIVVVPAGSVDALAGALASAGTGGIVILKSGLHTESGSVTITSRVNLIGEPGAILQVDTQTDAAFNDPALHLLGASRVLVWGIDLRPAQSSGNTAILLQDSPRATIGNNTISAHQVSVLIHESDRAFLFGNTITTSPDGFYGVEVVNGERVSIVGNEIANAPGFGVFACDRDGTFLLNHMHGNFIGLIFCNVPVGDATLPDGQVIGSDVPATDWTARWNNATDNAWGYLAIDGANGCDLLHNEASNNSDYDIELAGDSERFGFFTPTSSNCTAVSSNPAIVVKDCGLNNTVIGGTQVDTTVDPCF